MATATRRSLVDAILASDEERRKLLSGLMRDPIDYPEEMKGWVPRWIEANPPQLPASAIVGTTVLEVSSLPANPRHGQTVFFVADSTNRVIWHLRYNSTSVSSYKWEFIGGPWWKDIDTADETIGNGTTTGATYADPGGAADPALTLAVGGDYEVAFSAGIYHNTTAALVFISPKFGSAATADADGARMYCDTAGVGYHLGRTIVKTGLAAADVVKLQGRGNAITDVPHFFDRQIWVRPVRVG